VKFVKSAGIRLFAILKQMAANFWISSH